MSFKQQITMLGSCYSLKRFANACVYGTLLHGNILHYSSLFCSQFLYTLCCSSLLFKRSKSNWILEWDFSYWFQFTIVVRKHRVKVDSCSPLSVVPTSNWRYMIISLPVTSRSEQSSKFLFILLHRYQNQLNQIKLVIAPRGTCMIPSEKQS